MSIRPSIDTLRDIRHGGLLADLDEQLHELVTACVDTDKVGSLSVTLKIKPEGGFATVEDTIKANIPTRPSVTMFHITTENNLSLRDERQTDIDDLKSVDTTANSPKAVANGGKTLREV